MATSLLIRAAARGNRHVLRKLLQDGEDPNQTDDAGMTPLHHAAQYGRLTSIRILLEHGADPNRVTHEGLTPSMLLFSVPWGASAEVLRLLLDHGGGANACDLEGRTLLYVACHGEAELVKILLDHGANVNARTATDLTPLHRACQGEMDRRNTVYLLIENGADLNAIDQQGCAPIHDAAQFPQNGALAILAEIPAVNVHAMDKCGRTPYQIALDNPHTNAAGILKRRLARDMAEAQSSKKDPRVTL